MGLDKNHRFNLHRKNIDESLNARESGRYEEFRSKLTEADQRERLWSICESLEFVDAMRPLLPDKSASMPIAAHCQLAKRAFARAITSVRL